VTLQFELTLNQLIAVGEGLAKAIECLEATASNPADVYLLWLAVTAQIAEALTTAGLPDSVCAEIRGIINRRWRQFFIDGPTNVHLSAFYLNPGESTSDTWHLRMMLMYEQQHLYTQLSSSVLTPSHFPSHFLGRKSRRSLLAFEALKLSKRLGSTY
jgi:hypothetical protein